MSDKRHVMIFRPERLATSCSVCRKKANIELGNGDLVGWMNREKPIENALPDVAQEHRDWISSGKCANCR